MVASIDELLTWVLSQAAVRSHRVLQQRLGAAGLTGYEYRVLAALADREPLHQTELGQRAVLDRSDVTATIGLLRSRGLVDRQADPNHGRRVIVTITTGGLRTWRKAERVMTAVQDEVFDALSERERGVLRAVLTRVAPDPASA